MAEQQFKNVVEKCVWRMADQEFKKCGEERRIVSNEEWQISKEKMWWSKKMW